MAFYRVCGNYYGTDNDANSLKHYRTPGSKNGVRKYQYEDGSLTPAGKIHYGIGRGNNARGYTDTGTGQGPSGLGRLAYKTGGVQGYANYRKAASNVNKAAKGVGKTASSMARDAERWGSNVSKKITDAIGNQDELDRLVEAQEKYFKTAGPLYEGSRGYDERKTKQNRLNEVANKYNTAPYGSNSSDRREWDSRRMETGSELQRLQNEARVNSVNEQRNAALARKEYEEARKSFDDHPITKLQNGVQNAREWTDQAVKDAGKAVNDAKTWVGERASDVKKWGDQAGKDITKAASDVKNWGEQAAKDVSKAAADVKNWGEQAAKDVGKAAKNAGDWVGDRAKDVGNAVGTAAKNVGNAVSGAAKDVAKWGEGAVNKGRNFISGLFGKKKK